MKRTTQPLMLNAIDDMKQTLVEIASENGLTDPKTVKYSQKLDDMLNIYRRMYLKK